MKNFKEVPDIRQELDYITCDRCKKTYDDIMEIQEFLCYENDAGYGSIMGDGNKLRAELCQHCVKEVLGPYIRIVGNYIWNKAGPTHYFPHELPQDLADSIANSKMDPRHDHLNELLK